MAEWHKKVLAEWRNGAKTLGGMAEWHPPYRISYTSASETDDSNRHLQLAEYYSPVPNFRRGDNYSSIPWKRNLGMSTFLLKAVAWGIDGNRVADSLKTVLERLGGGFN